MILSKLIVALYDVFLEAILWVLIIASAAWGYNTADFALVQLSDDPDLHRIAYALACALMMLIIEVILFGFLLNISVMRRDIEEIKNKSRMSDDIYVVPSSIDDDLL